MWNAAPNLAMIACSNLQDHNTGIYCSFNHSHQLPSSISTQSANTLIILNEVRLLMLCAHQSGGSWVYNHTDTRTRIYTAQTATAVPYRLRDSRSGFVLSTTTLRPSFRAFSHADTHFCHVPSVSWHGKQNTKGQRQQDRGDIYKQAHINNVWKTSSQIRSST